MSTESYVKTLVQSLPLLDLHRFRRLNHGSWKFAVVLLELLLSRRGSQEKDRYDAPVVADHTVETMSCDFELVLASKGLVLLLP